MIEQRSYRFFLGIALSLHVLIAIFLMWDQTAEQPALEISSSAEVSHASPPPQAIQAVSVDAKDVAAVVNRLKSERAEAALAESNRQKALAMQAETARKKRLEEQKRVARLKAEANKLALAQKKQLEEEKKRLQQLAKQQEVEKQQLQALQEKQRQLQKQKEQEEKSLAALQAKKLEEQVLQRQQAAAEAARQKTLDDAAKNAKNAKIAGVVDRYKALIIHSISQQWILPDHVDSRLSSQFRIRLAPNGTVLEVSLVRSSGNSVLDRSAQAAIYKASPLPVPNDPEMFNLFRDISLTVRPENVQQF